MLEIEIFGYGSEFYSKKFDKNNFNEQDFLSKHKDDFYDLNDENFDMMTYADTDKNISINVTLNDKIVYEKEKTLLDHSIKASKITEINHREFSDAKENEKVVIWGHSIMLSKTYTFNEVEKFSIEKIEVHLLKLGNDLLINGITYNNLDADEEEPDFSPKHGYWGPYIY